ncbi:NTP/NDP exchange transporter [Sorangium cellulosum]|uniref:NTP/NDP exchange transporter n=1 Tax=Sorangium cellulosum TaxID=56 RepID=UPI001F2359A7|nr:Npt1/Npt2 family nucleotide transporter [Sorangium cellulosum]
MASTGENETAARGPLHRLLSIFAEVRPREAFSVLVLTLNVFLLLTGYYLLKVVREPLILAGGGLEIGGHRLDLDGPEVKAYASAGQALLLVGVVRAYGAMARRFGRMQLTTALTLFFAGNLVLFFFLARLGVPLGVPFYLWVGCFNLTVIAQFWSFANDVYTPEQGKRLFAIVGIGSSLGAMLGAQIAKRVYVPIGPYNMMLLAAGVLLVCLWLTRLVHRHELARAGAGAGAAAAKADAPPGGAAGGFGLIARDRYLLLIAGLTLVLNWVNSTGEYILDRTLIESATSALTPAGGGPGEPAPAPAAASGAAPGAPLAAGAPVYLVDPGASRLLEGKIAAERGGAFDVEAGGKIVENAEKGLVHPRTEAGKKAALGAVIGTFKGDFFYWVNTFGVLLQLFLVSRIFKYLGVRFALFILPSIALLGYASLAVLPVLAVVRVAKVAENSTDYSVQNTARQALFLPVGRDAKYSAKAAIDTFVVRAGDVLAAAVVIAGNLLALSTRHFAMINLALAVVWLGVVVGIAREHRRRTEDEPEVDALKAA